MEIKKNVELAPYTTFKIGGPARYFAVAENLADVKQACDFAKDHNLPILIIGGGSNMVVNDEGFSGLVLLIDLKGTETVKEDNDNVILKVAAGENWDSFVQKAVDNGWWGIENMSHIPGKIGAIAVQNVGAYGQEASQVIDQLTIYDINGGDTKIFKNDQCQFAYRSSIFNNQKKGRYVILDITFKLSKIPKPNLSYRDLKVRFEGKNPSIQEIRQSIIEIRNKKFPFPKEAINGNAGSFFKNPHLSLREYEKALARVKTVFGEEAANNLESKSFKDQGTVKVPAAFLIDICGFKSVENQNAAINANQPLVIINKTGKATAKDVLQLALKVQHMVYEKTGILLSQEPILVGYPSTILEQAVKP